MRARRAIPGEGTAAASLIRDSLPPELRAFTIWDSPKAHRYVEHVLALPPEAAPSMFYLLADDGGVAAGVAEFRWQDPQAFLNYIAVSPALRGRAYGRRLLCFAAGDFLTLHRAENVLLDVDPANGVACRWYGRLGFVRRDEIFWQVGPLCDGGSPGVILDHENSEMVHRRFGFSRLRINTEVRTHEAGLLQDDYFRVDEAGWADPGVHAALRRLDARRRVLVRLPEARPGLRTVHHTLRLGMKAGDLLKRLYGGRATATQVDATAMRC